MTGCGEEVTAGAAVQLAWCGEVCCRGAAATGVAGVCEFTAVVGKQQGDCQIGVQPHCTRGVAPLGSGIERQLVLKLLAGKAC